MGFFDKLFGKKEQKQINFITATTNIKSNYSDNDIVKILFLNNDFFCSCIQPLLNGVKNSWINIEEKVALIREAYYLYQTNGKWEKLSSQINNLNMTIKNQLTSQYIKTIKKREPTISDYWLSGKKKNMEKLFGQISSKKFLCLNLLETMNLEINRDIVDNPNNSIENPIWLKRHNFFTDELKTYYLITEQFYKYKFKIAFIKIFAFIDILEYIKHNPELSKIINNFIIKYKSFLMDTEQIYEIILPYLSVSSNCFSQEHFYELLNILIDIEKKRNFKNNNFENHYSLETLKIKDYVENYSFSYLVEKLINTKAFKNKNTEELLFNILLVKSTYINDLIDLLKILDEFKGFSKKIETAVLKEDLLNNDYSDESERISISDIDLMSGPEFEEFLWNYFNGTGYKCEQTKATGDQGVDLIAIKDDARIAIQAKCYSGVVGNHAIMEVFAGAKYYNANKCMVVTNSTFTKSAIELAKSNNVILWDRNVLIEKLSQI